MFNAADSYENDHMFHAVVDQMRALLGYYEITATELRLAATLASSMHEAQRIRPLFISKSRFSQLFGSANIDGIYVDEFSSIGWNKSEDGKVFPEELINKAVVQEKRKGITDRRTHGAYGHNPTKELRRNQINYANSGRNEHGDRRKDAVGYLANRMTEAKKKD